jgi:hypothetical protein
MSVQIYETPAEERAVKRFLAAKIRESMNRIEKRPPHSHQILYLRETLESWINRSDASIWALAEAGDMLRDLARRYECYFHFLDFEVDEQIHKIFGCVDSNRSGPKYEEPKSRAHNSGEPAVDTPF